MELIAQILLLSGSITILVGAIWLIVLAFQESVLWGLGCIFVPFVSLIFLIMHWQEARKPFLIQIAGLVPYALGIVLMGGE